MVSQMLALSVLAAVFCAGHALKCHSCTSIKEDQPTCLPADIQEVECGSRFTHCAKILMRKPAYGEVLKCATERECQEPVPRQVDRKCCDTDLCN